MNSHKSIYLATPYSDKNPIVEEQRYKAACEVTGILLSRGYVVLSPIVHCHPPACTVNLPKDYGFWSKFNRTWIERCDELWVVKMPGWNKSSGIREEIAIAYELKKPVFYLNYPSLDFEVIDNMIDNIKPLNFGEVLDYLKENPTHRAARAGWNGKGMWISLQIPDSNSKMTLPYIYMSTVTGDLVPWLASQSDLLASDWETL